MLFANSATGLSRHILTLFHYIWLCKLLHSNARVVNNGTILWTHGRIPKRWYVFCKYQTLELYMILCHLSYIYSFFDVGDMS
jgi:hypothetical protein